ncbi:MAG: hypothetical protein OEZ01_07125, partial [Candidatus Heimdallarchaeota archaeon]|nr:hypothetical protein [Candidatus Heimdallarchaeota archaeon]
GLREIRGDGNLVLAEGEQFEFVLLFSGSELDVSTQFSVDIIPSIGNELTLTRTTPTIIDEVNDL